MADRIKLTESELRNTIAQYVTEALEDEGLWNQIKAGAKSAFGNGVGDRSKRQGGGLNIGKRWNAAKTGFQQQGKVDEIDTIINYLEPLVQSGKIDPNQTVGQLLHRPGGKNGGFKKGSLGQMRAAANSKASKAQNDIYR